MKRKMSVFLFVVILGCAVFTGCSKDTKETAQENVKDSMVTENSESETSTETRTIKDMAGRTVEVPLQITKVYSSGQPGIIMMHNINLDKLVGWCFELRDYEKKYLDAKYQELPVVGALQGKKGTVSKEELLSYEPEIILSMGSIVDSSAEEADSLQQDLGIPVVVVDGDLKNLDKSYEFLGELLDEKEITDQLAQYCRDTMEQVNKIVEKIPEKEKKRVYYAGGEKGLETGGVNSWHAELIDYSGGINVADFDAGSSRNEVSLEQVITWNPDVIVEAIYDDMIDGVFDSVEWQGIKAVKDGEIYSAPDEPYNWFDTPPSSNRLIGLKWMVSILYPEYNPFDMKQEVKDFYKLFYKVDLSDEEVEGFLNTKVTYQ